MVTDITEQEILAFQKNWGDAVVHIGKLHIENKSVIEAAIQLVENFYGYNEGSVFFKPTKAREIQFRFNAEGAVSYFIGKNSNYPEDLGFALQPWIKVRFENAGFMHNSNQVINMGNYYFTDLQNNDTKVEYTIGYFRNAANQIKINLHHSSLPYSVR